MCVKQAQVATEMCPLRPLVTLVMGVSASEREEGWLNVVMTRGEWGECNRRQPLMWLCWKIGVCRRIKQHQATSVLRLGMVHGYSLVIWRITLTTHKLHFISSSASTFGACVVLFSIATFHRLGFTPECFRMKARRSPANEMFATQNLNKLAK